jgi:hypothetical protein
MSSNDDWFAKRLGQQTQQGRTDITPPMPPSQQPMPMMPQTQPTIPQLPSSTQMQLCPDCNSNNYLAGANSPARCFDCGYPISQQGSKYGALSTARVEGGVGESLGNAKGNNYNPQGIIGRIQ